MKVFDLFHDVHKQAISIARELDIIDQYHFQHSINVYILAMAIGGEMDMERSELEELGLAAMLHDIGKIAIPHYILTMRCKPNEDEWDYIRRHPLLGYEMAHKHGLPAEACLGVLHHHERMDGSGYPFGLKADKISKYGRIIAIADVYDAMRSKRSYKSSAARDEAFNFLIDNEGTHFDSVILDKFKSIYLRQL